MTPSLHTRVVEAGARAITKERERGKTKAEFDRRSEIHAEAALDAMLVCLTENVDEWESEYWGPGETVFDGHPWEEGRVRSIAGRLLDVLRNPV